MHIKRLHHSFIPIVLSCAMLGTNAPISPNVANASTQISHASDDDVAEGLVETRLVDGDLRYAIAYDEASCDRSVAEKAMAQDGIPEKVAHEVADGFFGNEDDLGLFDRLQMFLSGSSFADRLYAGAIEVPGYERSGDGSNIEGISVRWITEDTEDDGNEDTLYIRPADDEKQTVRIRVNYDLSGEHDYNPGDIQITIPGKMFYDRTGKFVGTIKLYIST